MELNITAFIRILFCLVLGFTLSHPASAKTVEVGNEFFIVKSDNHLLSIESKKIRNLKVLKCILNDIVESEQVKKVEDSLWGKGEQLIVNHGGNQQTSFTAYSGNPFLHVHTTFLNKKSEDLQFDKIEFATLEMSIGNSLKNMNVLGTGGMTPIDSTQGSYTYSLLAEPKSRNSILTAWLSQRQGIGILVPELIGKEESSTYRIRAILDFGNYLVRAGKTRGTDILIIGFFEDGRKGLELFGDHLAREYQIKLPEKPEVYCTWYHKDFTGSGASNEKLLTENAEFASKFLSQFGLNVMQIDDNWQDAMVEGVNFGNWKKFRNKNFGGGPIKVFEKGNENFPQGMEYTAKMLSRLGFIPGLWFIPFAGDTHHSYFNKNIFSVDKSTGKPYDSNGWSGAPIDASSTEGEAFLRLRFKRIYDWGYRYFKIDGLHTGAPSTSIYVNRSYDGKPIFADAKIQNPDMTFVQCFRRGMSILKEEAPKAFILGCNMAQNMLVMGSSFGLLDAMRVGPDNGGAAKGAWSPVTRGADFAGNLYFLNNRVWYSDPDPYYVSETSPLNRARWMVSWQSVSGVMSTTSIQYSQLSSERLDLIKRGLPTHKLNAYPVDILEQEKPQIWMVGNDRMSVIGLFNWIENQSTTIKYNLGRMGLDENKSYELFDFWNNKYLGSIKNELISILEPASCQILAARPVKAYPQLISTSRHITQGLIDVVSESWENSSKKLIGTSKVVASDSYELRIVVPKEYLVKEAVCNGEKMKFQMDGNILRATYLPVKTEIVTWYVKF